MHDCNVKGGHEFLYHDLLSYPANGQCGPPIQIGRVNRRKSSSFAGQATMSDENDCVRLRNGQIVSGATGWFFYEKGV